MLSFTLFSLTVDSGQFGVMMTMVLVIGINVRT